MGWKSVKFHFLSVFRMFLSIFGRSGVRSISVHLADFWAKRVENGQFLANFQPILPLSRLNDPKLKKNPTTKNA